MGYAHHRIILDADQNPIDYEFIDVNTTFEKLTGLLAQQIIGKTVRTVIPTIASGDFDWIGFYGEVALHGGEKEFEQYSEPLKKWYQVHVYSTEHLCFTTMFIDITTNKQKTEELEAFFSVNLDLLCIADLNGNFIKTNQAWSRILGYSTEELNAKKFLEFVHPDDIQPTLDAMANLSKGDDVLDFTNRYRARDGSYRYIEWHSHPKGDLIYAAARDVTDKTIAQDRLDQAMSHSSMYVWEIDCNGIYTFVGTGVEHVLGYTPAEMVGKMTCFDLLPENSRREAVESFTQLFNQKDSYESNETIYISKSGTRIWLATSGHPVFDFDGSLKGYRGTDVNITRLKESEQQYSSLVANIPGITYRCKADKDLTMLFMSSQVDSITGYSAQELYGNAKTSYGNLIHPEDQELVTHAVQTGITKNQPWDIEYRVLNKSGLYRWVREKGSAVKNLVGQVEYLDGFILDITEQKHIQDALVLSEERFQRALSGAGAGLWDWDMVKNTVFFSPQWKNMLGYEDHEIPNNFTGWKNLWHPDEAQEIEQTIKDYLEGRTDTYEVQHRLRAKDGSWRWILTRGDIEKDQHGNPIRWTGTNVDITLEKLAQEALLYERELFSDGPVFTIEWDPSNNWPVRTVSSNIEQILGYKPEFMKSHDFHYAEIIHPEDRDRIFSEVKHYITNHIDTYEQSYRLRCADGEYRWFHDFTKLVRYRNGSLKAIRGYMYDQTQQKQFEDELRTSQETLKTYIDGSPLGIFVSDFHGRYIDVNPAGEDLFGFTREELFTKTIVDVLPEDQHLKATEIARQTKETGIGEGVIRALKKDGTAFWLWIVARNVNNQFLLAFCQDVTERITAEQELKKERIRLEGILEGTNVGTWEWNVQTGETVFNQRWAEIIGYTLEEISPVSIETWIQFAHPDDLKASGEQLEEHFRGERAYYDFESRMKHKNGDWVWVLDRGKVVSWTGEGKPLLMLGTHQDVTQRKQTEKEKEYQMALFRALFEESTVGIALNDMETGKFIDVNYKLIEPTGYTREEFLNLSYWDLTPKEYVYLEENALSEMRTKGYYTSFEKEYIRKDGSRYPVRLNGVVVESDNGKKHIWSIIEDISVQKQNEEALIHARKQAELASKAKSEFLANMSHEIRTPLNGIIGFTDLLKSTPLTPVQEQYLQNVKVSGESLLGIINDILDFSKIEAGMLHLEQIKVDMVELLDNSIDIVKFQSDNKNLELLFHVTPTMPRFAYTDPIRLKQILANLLGNAVKFTEKGEVELKVDYTPLSDTRG